MRYFRGHPYVPPSSQEGHGLGSILSSIARTAIPFLKPIAKTIGRTVLDKGCEVGRDVIEGQNLKTSFRKRVFGQNPPQEGSGGKRRRRRRRSRAAVKPRRRKPGRPGKAVKKKKKKKKKTKKNKRGTRKRATKRASHDIFS